MPSPILLSMLSLLLLLRAPATEAGEEALRHHRLPDRSLQSPCLFYTNWRTCLNDCNEEPWDTLHDTREQCCSTHHSYGGPGGYIDCIGSTEPPATSPTGQCPFYTNWRTCVNDCNQVGWNSLHGTREECCSVHHSYRGPGGYADCIGDTGSNRNPNPPPAPTSPTPCLFYSSGITCVNDCNEEGWNILHDTLEECCTREHNWVGAGGYAACMGTLTQVPAPAPSGASQSCQFYSHWSGTCIEDCEGGFTQPMHASLEACCLVDYAWSEGAYETCMGVDTTSFYVDWNVRKCVQNCDVVLGVPCGGIRRDPYVHKYENVQQCCETHLSYLCPRRDIPCAACTDADISDWTR